MRGAGRCAEGIDSEGGGGTTALLNPNLGTTPKKDAAVAAISTITQDSTHVKERLLASFGALIGPLLKGPLLPGATAERRVWQVILAVGRLVLEMMLSRACLAATLQAASSSEPLRFRLDGSYTIQRTTTMGVIRVPLFAYFDAGGRVRAPARAAVFPYRGRCRSSELALEWEARLGACCPSNRRRRRCASSPTTPPPSKTPLSPATSTPSADCSTGDGPFGRRTLSERS